MSLPNNVLVRGTACQENHAVKEWAWFPSICSIDCKLCVTESIQLKLYSNSKSQIP